MKSLHGGDLFLLERLPSQTQRSDEKMADSSQDSMFRDHWKFTEQRNAMIAKM